MVKRLAAFIWELPQNLVGLILIFAYRNSIISKEKIRGRLFLQVRGFGASLGNYIFWSVSNKGNNKQHEYGHSVQSLILGPLYLIVVGIPSVLRVLYSTYYFKRNKVLWTKYFNGYPENWADRLGKKYFQ